MPPKKNKATQQSAVNENNSSASNKTNYHDEEVDPKTGFLLPSVADHKVKLKPDSFAPKEDFELYKSALDNAKTRINPDWLREVLVSEKQSFADLLGFFGNCWKSDLKQSAHVHFLTGGGAGSWSSLYDCKSKPLLWATYCQVRYDRGTSNGHPCLFYNNGIRESQSYTDQHEAQHRHYCIFCGEEGHPLLCAQLAVDSTEQRFDFNKCKCKSWKKVVEQFELLYEALFPDDPQNNPLPRPTKSQFEKQLFPHDTTTPASSFSLFYFDVEKYYKKLQVETQRREKLSAAQRKKQQEQQQRTSNRTATPSKVLLPVNQAIPVKNGDDDDDGDLGTASTEFPGSNEGVLASDPSSPNSTTNIDGIAPSFVIDFAKNTTLVPERFTPEEIDNCKNFYGEYIAANYPNICAEKTNGHAVQLVPKEPWTNGWLLMFCSGECCKRQYAASTALNHFVVPGIFYAQANPKRLDSSGAFVDAIVKCFLPPQLGKEMERKTEIAAFKSEVDAYSALYQEELLCRVPDTFQGTGYEIKMKGEGQVTVQCFLMATRKHGDDLQDLLFTLPNKNQQLPKARSDFIDVPAVSPKSVFKENCGGRITTIEVVDQNDTVSVTTTTHTFGTAYRTNFHRRLQLAREVIGIIHSVHQKKFSSTINQPTTFVHGDVKPRNFVGFKRSPSADDADHPDQNDEDRLIPIDFEFSSVRGDDGQTINAAQSQRNSYGGISPYWCSPAKFVGKTEKKTQPADDSFSAALVLYEIFHGDPTRANGWQNVPQFWIDYCLQKLLMSMNCDLADPGQREKVAKEALDALHKKFSTGGAGAASMLTAWEEELADIFPRRFPNKSYMTDREFKKFAPSSSSGTTTIATRYSRSTTHTFSRAAGVNNDAEIPPTFPAQCNALLETLLDRIFCYYAKNHSYIGNSEPSTTPFNFKQHFLFYHPSVIRDMIVVLYEQFSEIEANGGVLGLDGEKALLTIVEDKKYSKKYFDGLSPKDQHIKAGEWRLIEESAVKTSNNAAVASEYEEETLARKNLEREDVSASFDRSQTLLKHINDTRRRWKKPSLNTTAKITLFEAIRQFRHSISHPLGMDPVDVVEHYIECCPEILADLQNCLWELEAQGNFACGFVAIAGRSRIRLDKEEKRKIAN